MQTDWLPSKYAGQGQLENATACKPLAHVESRSDDDAAWMPPPGSLQGSSSRGPLPPRIENPTVLRGDSGDVRHKLNELDALAKIVSDVSLQIKEPDVVEEAHHESIPLIQNDVAKAQATSEKHKVQE